MFDDWHHWQNFLSHAYQALRDWLTTRQQPALISAIILIAGFLINQFFSHVVIRPWRKRFSSQSVLIITKGFRYGLFLLVILLILQQFNVELAAILGAAGIAGIAIGFAAQTSLSNIISGLFLLWEKPFEVDDIIKVNDITGTVESIDLLSLTLRTFDNLSVRIPNESIVKGQIVNITRHPIRRYDLKLGTAHEADPRVVMQVLRQVASDSEFVLEEPEPLIAFTGFSESALEFTVGAWHERDDFIAMRNSFLIDIKKAFDEKGIEIPYPHRVIINRHPGGEREIPTLNTPQPTQPS